MPFLSVVPSAHSSEHSARNRHSSRGRRHHFSWIPRFANANLEWNFFGRAQTINCKFKFIQLLFAAAHLAPLMGVISHALSITAPLSHTGTTYRPQVLIKGKKERKEKQLTSAVEKWANASCHTSDPRVKVQMKEWSLSVARYLVIRSMQLPPSALTYVRRQAFFPFFFFLSFSCRAVVITSSHLLLNLYCLISIRPIPTSTPQKNLKKQQLCNFECSRSKFPSDFDPRIWGCYLHHLSIHPRKKFFIFLIFLLHSLRGKVTTQNGYLF